MRVLKRQIEIGRCQRQFRDELTELWSRPNRSSDGTTRVDAEDVQVLAVRCNHAVDGSSGFHHGSRDPAEVIAEYVGRLNTASSAISIAHMMSPHGWQESGQIPEFDEYTLVLRGVLRVEARTLVLEVCAGQAIVTRKGEWVRYSTPGEGGAECVAICVSAFSPQTVHRDA
jgi:hypothetical protein